MVSVAFLAAALVSAGCGGGGSGDGGSPGTLSEPADSQATPDTEPSAEPDASDSLQPASGPDSASTFELPETTANPASVDISGLTEVPAVPEATEALGTPAAPAAPVVPATPEAQEVPEALDVPEPLDAPEAPGSPDTVEPIDEPGGQASETQSTVLADGPALSADSDLGRLTTSLRRIGVAMLVDLNVALNSGTPLDTAQQACTADHEPDLGEPLLQFDCGDNALSAVDDVLVSQTALADTDACSASLQSGSAADCRLASLRLVIPTRFVFPELTTDGDGLFTPQRPLPIDGADVAFRETGLDQLVIRNDPGTARGDYVCDVELTSGIVTDSGSTIVDCEQEISRVNERLTTLLDAGGF